MFDVAFSEMLVIAVVALIVIGPEKLPKVARTLGLLAGRLQRYVATVKADVERELRTEELGKLQTQARSEVAALESAVRSEIEPVIAPPAASEEGAAITETPPRAP